MIERQQELELYPARAAGKRASKKRIYIGHTPTPPARRIGEAIDEIMPIVSAAKTAPAAWWNGCKWDD